MSRWWAEPQRVIQTNLRLVDAAIDCRAVAREVKEFGATAIMFNVGGIFAWYPTKLPLQALNPYLKGRDVLGEMIEACKAEGLQFLGRYDLSKGKQVAFEAHPEWFCRTKEGRFYEYNGTYQASITGGWCHQQALELLTETLTTYEIDAVFFNMAGYQRFSYSHEDFGFSHDPSAVARFAEFSGGMSIPDPNDPADPAYRTYLRFQDATTVELSRKIADHIHAISPDIGIALPGVHDWVRSEANRSIMTAALDWPYQSGERIRAHQSLDWRTPMTVGITHFFDFPWRYAGETAARQLNRNAQAIANGGQPGYYFMGPISAQPDRKAIEPMREAFAYYVRNEATYRDLAPAANVGLYHSAKTNRYGAFTVQKDVHGGRPESFRGAYRALIDSGIAFDAIEDIVARDGDLPATLSRFEVVVLPDITCMTDAECAAIDAYVENGGRLIVTAGTSTLTEFGEARPRRGLRCLPLEEDTGRIDNTVSCYFRTDGDLLPQRDIVLLDGPYWQVSTKAGTEKMMRRTPPQTFGPPELAFTEEQPTDDPGLVIGRYGKGEVAYLPWAPDRLFNLYGLQEHREILASLVNRFSPPLAKLERASRIELTQRRNERTGQFVVHLVNYSGQTLNSFDDPVVQHGLRLGVRNVSGKSCRALVAERDVPFGSTDADGFVWIDVPPVEHMEALVFDLAR